VRRQRAPDRIHEDRDPGGSGPVGGVLARAFRARGDDVVIHDANLVRAIDFLIARDDLDSAVNLSAPSPLPQRDFMAALRAAWGRRLGLPATRWMAELGAFVLRTDTELLLESRRVVPARLIDTGFPLRSPRVAHRRA
jgi:NAD dependent epimerase/dehydratase family enzyme